MYAKTCNETIIEKYYLSKMDRRLTYEYKF